MTSHSLWEQNYWLLNLWFVFIRRNKTSIKSKQNKKNVDFDFARAIVLNYFILRTKSCYFSESSELVSKRGIQTCQMDRILCPCN